MSRREKKLEKTRNHLISYGRYWLDSAQREGDLSSI